MSTRRSSVALAAGSAVGGLLSYVVFAITTHTLGPVDSAPVSVLWSYWAFAGAAFTFPLQHWVTRALTAHGDGEVRAGSRSVAAAVLAASLVTGALALLGRDLLFHTSGAGFAVLVAVITLGSALTGVMRGELSAHGRFGAVGVSLLVENGGRVLAVVVAAAAGAEDPVVFGVCLALGHLVVLVWPSWLRLARRSPVARSASRPAPPPASGPLGFLAGAAVSQVLGQGLLTVGPVLVALVGGAPAAVTALFAAFALFRAPYMLGIGQVAQLTGHVVRLAHGGRHADLRRLRRLVWASTPAATGLAAVLAAVLGPPLLELVFGDGVRLGRLSTAVVAAACALAVANLVLTTMVLALDRATRSGRAWLAAVTVGAGTFLLLGGPTPTERTVAAVLVAEAVAFCGLLLGSRPPRTA